MTQQQTPPAMRALRATYDEARASRAAAESLSPLLTLLDPPAAEEGSPLDEVTDLLRAVLAAQQKTLAAIEALAARIDGQKPRRGFPRSFHDDAPEGRASRLSRPSAARHPPPA